MDVDHMSVDSPGGKLLMRVDKPGPAGQRGGRPLPVIVYYRGGGWTIANLDSYDASCRALSKMVGAMVVSVSYRTSPE